MNILGIGPGELLLIFFVLLIVVGPERLPDLARQLAQLLVRVRNWIQHSPDAAMVLRARQEIEQELASIKASLLEVQSVRDELIGTARQIEDSVNTIGGSQVPLPQSQGLLHEPAFPEDPESLSVEDDRQRAPVVAEHPTDIGRIGPAPHDALSATPPLQHAEPIAQAQLEEINLRLQAVMTDLWALQNQLREQGLLGSDWQPPSYAMQLPEQPNVSTPGPSNGTAEQPVAASDTPNQEAPDVID